MIISDIRTTLLRLPEVNASGDGLQDVLIIEIQTDEGLVGIGEAHTMPSALKAIIDAPLSQLAVQGLRILLVGESADDIDALHWKMHRYCGSVLGSRGLVLHAISGIDIALWDLKGKATGRPVCDLVGGRKRDEVDVYASDLMPQSADELFRTALIRAREGYRYMKFGWGKIGSSPSEDFEILSELRRRLGDDVGLMVDVGIPMQWEDALWLAKKLYDIGVEFLEEPLDTDDLAGYAALSAASPTRIAAGERAGSQREFEDLMTKAKLRVIQPDLARCGGFGVARRIAIDASTRGVQVVPHCWSSDILVAATIHFLSSLDQLAPLEFNVMNQPLRTELVVNPIRPCDGKVRVPDGVGLGIELNLDTVEKFRVK